MTANQIRSCVRELSADDVEMRWLEAATALVRDVPLFATPKSESEASYEPIYSAIRAIVRQLAGPEYRGCERTFKALDELARQRPHRVDEYALPSDIQTDIETLFADGGFFIGLAMGLRLARTLDVREGA